MKKFLSVFLAILMLLSVIPLTVSAETTEKANTFKLTVNGEDKGEYDISALVGYSTSNVLFTDVVPSGATVVIELLGNVTSNGRAYISDKNLDVTIEGNGYTWYGNTTVFLLEEIGRARKFLAKDTTFESAGDCIRLMWGYSSPTYTPNYGTDVTKVDVTFQNCKLISNAAGGGKAAIEVRPGSKPIDINLINTEVIGKGTCPTLITSNAGGTAAITINVKNDASLGTQTSKLIYEGTTSMNAPIYSYNVNDSVTINLEDGTVLNMSAASTAARCGLVQMSRGYLTLNTKAGSEVIFNGHSTATSYEYAVNSGCTINDEGATWTIDATVAKKGITLPTVTGKQWKIKDTDTWVTSPYSNADATGSVSLVAATNYADMVKVTVGETSEEINISNLQTKLAALEAGSTVTIDLLDNVSLGEMEVPNNYLTIIINGHGCTWTMPNSSSNYIMNRVVRAKSITFNNIVLNSAAGGFHTLNGSDANANPSDDAFALTFKDCNITTNGRYFFEIKAYVNANNVANGCNVIFDNSTVVHNGTSCMAIGDGIGNAVSVTMNDSDFTMTNGGKDSLAWYQFIYGGAKTVALNMNDNSNLVVKYADDSAKVVHNVINLGDKNTDFTMSIDATSSVALESNSETATFAFVTLTNASTNVTVNDEGAAWKVSANVANKGVTLPSVTAAEGKTFIGFTDGSKLYGKTATVADAAANVSFTAVTFSNEDFNMSNTVSMRLENPNGIRFKLNVSKTLVDYLGENATYHVLLAPASDTAELTEGTESRIRVDAENGWSESDETYNYLRVALSFESLDSKAANLELAARGALKVKYADGSTSWIYTAKTDKASLVTVAELAQQDSELYNANKTIIDNILALKEA